MRAHSARNLQRNTFFIEFLTMNEPQNIRRLLYTHSEPNLERSNRFPNYTNNSCHLHATTVHSTDILKSTFTFQLNHIDDKLYTTRRRQPVVGNGFCSHIVHSSRDYRPETIYQLPEQHTLCVSP